MTTNEYAEYVKAFNAGIDGLTALSTGSRLKACHECCSEHDTFEHGDVSYQDTESFSFYRCSVCESTLGGNRTVGHAWLSDDDTALIHLRVCDDCVYYLEYGRLDDATMAELETLSDVKVLSSGQCYHCARTDFHELDCAYITQYA